MAVGSGSLTVKAGAVFTWQNGENMMHTVTADDGNTYSHTFNTVGTYAYHSGMKGAIVMN